MKRSSEIPHWAVVCCRDFMLHVLRHNNIHVLQQTTLTMRDSAMLVLVLVLIWIAATLFEGHTWFVAIFFIYYYSTKRNHYIKSTLLNTQFPSKLISYTSWIFQVSSDHSVDTFIIIYTHLTTSWHVYITFHPLCRHLTTSHISYSIFTRSNYTILLSSPHPHNLFQWNKIM